MVMSFLSRDIDSCSLPFVMKSLPRPGIMLYNVHMYRRVIVYNVHIQVGSTDSGPEDSLTPDSTHATAIWQQMHIHLQIQQYGNTTYSKEKNQRTIIWPNGPIFMMFWNCSYMSRSVNWPENSVTVNVLMQNQRANLDINDFDLLTNTTEYFTLTAHVQ